MVQYTTALSKCTPIKQAAGGTLSRIQMSAFSNHLRVIRDGIRRWLRRGARITLFSDANPSWRSSYYRANRELMLMRIVTMLFLACLACGVTRSPLLAAANPVASAPSTSEVEPIRTVELKFAAFNRHDAAAIETLYASNAILRSPDYPELLGNSKIADTYRWIFDAIPDAKDSIVTIESTANHVYVQFVLSGHLKSAENKPINVRIMSVYTVKDHLVVSDSTYYDRKTP
jgi:limonene-1,2-epoxide hydrolase